MAATDAQITVAAARWCDEGRYLREFVARHRLPAAAKVVKGQYAGLGVPTLPSPGLQSAALLVSVGKRRKILAQAVKIKEGRRLVCVGPRLLIPDTYPGYFELLSEEGRAVRCIESVAELARRRPEEGCLVREAVRAVQARVSAPAAGADGAPPGALAAAGAEPAVVPEGARTVPPGEVLHPAGECVLPGSKGRYLKCVDSRGDTLLLGLEQRGKFSALAREDNISGVHTAKVLLSKRLPLTVRLVHGTAPRGLKSPSHFVPELRLLSVLEEEHVFALPLQREANSVAALPLAAPLKLLRARNDDQLRATPEFQRLADKCARLAAEVADRIQVLEGKLGDPKKLAAFAPTSGVGAAGDGAGAGAGAPKNGYLLRRSASSDAAGAPRPPHGAGRHHRRTPDDGRALAKDYDEIDQIYDYVRGFAPLPKGIKSPFADDPSPPPASHASAPSRPSSDAGKPEPPPIETIPTKKPQQAEKRGRRAAAAVAAAAAPVATHPPPAHPPPPGGGGARAPLPKLYVKNGRGGAGARLLRQKSASPMKEGPPSPASKAGSPLFNIRYKSLNNLQQAMELDGTLDSSNSGGRASGDSAGGPKQPEKRCRKLSRPRSLTNLVWETRLPADQLPPPPPVPAPHHDAAMPLVGEKRRPDGGALAYRKHGKYAGGGGSRARGTLYL